MTNNLWPRPRRTTGSGPPPNMRFGEFAYSDADGLIHVGRPDGTVRSFGESGTTTTARTVGGKVRVLALGGFRK